MDSQPFDLATYHPILIFLLAAILVAVGVLAAAHIVGPRRQTPVKQMPYESGMDPIGDTRQRFDVKFYLIAITFLIFDVELLFLYPWAVIAYREPPVIAPELRWTVFGSVLVFIGLLTVAYVYEWRKGVFRWR